MNEREIRGRKRRGGVRVNVRKYEYGNGFHSLTDSIVNETKKSKKRKKPCVYQYHTPPPLACRVFPNTGWVQKKSLRGVFLSSTHVPKQIAVAQHSQVVEGVAVFLCSVQLPT